MNVVVTTIKDINYRAGYLVYSSLKDLNSNVGTIDTLIYHEASDERTEDIYLLVSVFKKAGDVIYIHNERSVNNTIRILTEGKKGRYINDEYYLLSRENLEVLLDRKDGFEGEVSQVNLQMLETLYSKLLNNEPVTPAYVQVLLKSLENIKKESQSNVDKLNVFCEEIWNILSELKPVETKIEPITSVQLEQKSPVKEPVIKQEVLEKPVVPDKESTNDPWQLYKTNMEGEGVFASPIDVRLQKGSSLLLIKDFEHCNYLFSFVLGFQHYLNSTKKIKTRIIVFENAGKVAQYKYKDYTWVTQSTYNKLGVKFHDPVIFMDFYDDATLKKLVEDKKYFRATIILDRTNYAMTHIVSLDKSPDIIYATNSAGFIRKQGISEGNCITSVIKDENKHLGYHIDTISDYEQYRDNLDRLNAYVEDYSTMYEDILQKVGSIRDVGRGR